MATERISPSTSWLTEVLRHSYARAQALRELGLAYWRARSERRSTPPSWTAQMRRPAPLHVIAEVKRRAPSAGTLQAEADAEAIARSYQAAGASAVSVLTEPLYFSGTMDDLRRVAGAVSIPVLRKDFLVDPLQVVEAACAGASAVLVIGRLLDAPTLRRVLEMARAMRVDVLYEVFTADEARRGLDMGCRCIGINNRDLETLAVDPWHALRVYGQVEWPEDAVVVVESGLEAPDVLRRYTAEGLRHFLVGSAFMRSDRPGDVLRTWLQAWGA
ncbi:Indole-3-glycerol phosphate synthase [bacterium HR11]|nr:Indole-3-glycerol phosphate synthase [bacterium HR11]